MNVTKHIICELTGYRPGVVDVSQGDRGSRAVSCRLLENGASWMIPEGATVRVAYTLPDGTEGLYDVLPDGFPAGEISGNTVTVDLADQLMAQAGMVQASILIISPEGGQLATWPIRVMVGANKAARLTVPENMPPYGAGFAGKIFFGGADGTVTPLGIGEGVEIVRNEDGSFALIAAGGGIQEEEDPTVPAWAKQSQKPTYTAQEVGALPAGTKIPAKTSDLTNDSGFITKSVADLVNYYTKTQTEELIAQIPQFRISVVQQLPAAGEELVLYLVPFATAEGQYLEYIWVAGRFEVIGSQKVDLTGYATEVWVQDYVEEHSGQSANRRTQYIKKKNLTSGYFWHKTASIALPYKYSYRNYSVLEPLTLAPGTYYLSAVASAYSHIVINGVVQKLMDFEPAAGPKYPESNFVLTLTENATLYLTYYHVGQITATTPYVVDGDEPLENYYEMPFDLSDFVEPYIKNGELVANYLGDGFATQGHYTAVKMSGNVKKMMCKARFVDGAAFTLVATKNGAASVIDITRGSVHLGFYSNECSVGVFDSLDNLRIIRRINYDGVIEGTTVAFGFAVDESANTLTVYLPNGTTETLTDESFTAQNGPFAIWEHFCNVAGSGFKAGVFSKLWCEDYTGEILDDDLNRLDGAIGTAPTGQVYQTFTTFNGNNRDFK